MSAGDTAGGGSDLDVSVVIPAYNAEAILPDTLRALTQGTFPAERMEIIVVDDGSKDGTAAAAADFPVQVIRQENQGPAAARSHGVDEAGGRVVVFSAAFEAASSPGSHRANRPRCTWRSG